MVQLIVAVDNNWGIGRDNRLPWHNREEMRIFKEKTMGRTLIVGRKTYESLPPLRGRKILCLSRGEKNNEFYMDNLESAINGEDARVFIAGGAQVYESALKGNMVDVVHLSSLDRSYDCDTFFSKDWLKNFVVVDEENHGSFNHYVMKKTEKGEEQYLDLLRDILHKGKERVGRNGPTISLFKNDMVFDLRNGFPLLTTKKMFLRGILEEFLFFVRGETNSNLLSEKKVKIWEGNTTKEFIESRGLKYSEGVMGPLYGWQWRFFNAPYALDENGFPERPKNGVDQLQNVVDLIKNDPTSRRILLTAYNPEQAEQGVLYPCHSISIQFYVDGDFLDMFCYNRSSDAFLGVPFNIASTSLLLMTIAKITGKTARYFHLTMGDTHIYEGHRDAAQEQVQRIPYAFPRLKIPDVASLAELERLEAADFELEGYRSHKKIKASMVV